MIVKIIVYGCLMGFTITILLAVGLLFFKVISREATYTLGNCSCCNSTNIIITDKKIVCLDCGNWTWLEDAINSCWIRK